MLSITVFLLGSAVVGCRGQTSKLFQWQFKDQSLSTQLPTCVAFPIVVKPFNATANNTVGVPPYYMISFPTNGTPMTTLIGSDPDNLSWTVTHPTDSKLLLSVVDSLGSAGGIPPQLLTVIPGQTTQCVTTPAPLARPFTVTANVTGNLETCQPWGITVSGGSPPYTITLAETNSPVVTNVTMPFGANRFTYPNRADPGGILIAAISDLEGRWATGTPSVQAHGSTDTTCTGFVSSSGDAATIDAQDAALNAQITASKRRKALVTGVAVTLVVLLVIGCAVMWYLRYRKHVNIKQKRVSEQRARQYSTTDIPQGWETFDTAVRPFELVGSSMPAYGKPSRAAPRAPPIALSEPDIQAPPYQEVESPTTSLEVVAAGGSTLPYTSTRDMINVSEKASLSTQQSLPRIIATTVRPKSSSTQPPLSSSGSSRSQPTVTSSSSTTTTEMMSAFPEVPISIPTKPHSTQPRPSRKTSAGFVTFPQKSVRVSAVSNLSAKPREDDKGADSRSTPGSTPSVQAIAEEPTLPPKSGLGEHR